MDKLKNSLKHLFAPAIVLLLVAIMGVFSPVVSVAAALRLYTADVVGTAADVTVENLPERTVKVGDLIASPTVTGGTKELWHAGRSINVVNGTTKYDEVGQYEWRFFNGGVLFDTYTVTATKTTYTMTMPSKVITVAPKGMDKLELPMPTSYTVGGDTMEVVSVTASTNTEDYAIVALKDKKGNTTNYHLSVEVNLENDTFAQSLITINEQKVSINLDGHKESTGNLKVTYMLSDSNDKLLVAVPLKDIEIKNVKKGEVTFANIPTAPSVSNLVYYSSVALSEPTADSAKVNDELSFTVDAQTSIVKVQAYLFSKEPNWKKSSADIHNLTVENGVVKENGQVSDLLEIDGLNVKVKALGWYRFQFETSTLFGYKMDKDFDNYDAIEQDNAKSYVRYWSDSIRIYRDTIEPNFAWVEEYNKDSYPVDYDENFSEYLNKFETSLPMTEKPDATTTKKITVNFTQGLTLPAIFPHDNATKFADMSVTAFSVEQIQDADGNSVSNNYVWKGETATNNTFVYDMTKRMQIKFAADGIGSGTQLDNEIVLKSVPGLYRVRVVVEEKQPIFQGDNEKYSGGYAQTKTKYLYFYADNDTNFPCGAADNNSPVIDENNVFQVSDVYLWEGKTFDFPAVTVTDAHTPTDQIEIDYYLVYNNTTDNEVIAKLDYTKGASRISVDLDELPTINSSYYTTGNFYIYAVARNFNGMQANLKEMLAGASHVVNETCFDTELFNTNPYKSQDKVAQYGYAWKRAAFNFHTVNANRDADITVGTITAADGKFVAGNTITIPSIKTEWDSGNVVDGQMSVAVYQVKANNVLVPVDLVNSQNASAEIVSTFAFKRNEFTVNNLYFTPGTSGNYILVVTSKDYASNKIQSNVTTIAVGSSSEISVRPRTSSLSTAAVDSNTIDKTIALGSSLTLPDYDLVDGDNNPLYIAKNRELLDASTLAVKGDYTITVIGVNDANCITGNKFVPSKTGKYKFRYDFYKEESSVLKLIKTVNYVVQVNDTNASSSILMGEEYNQKNVLWATGVVDATDANITDYTVAGKTYDVGVDGTGTENKPAYAITLPQFKMANYGASNDFVIDSAWLYQYLEPIYGAVTTTNTTNITGYMYPAIAIPMANIVTDNISSDDVEVTVQKSGSSNYLVSSKKLNAGGSNNKASVIEKIGDYFVFRPFGKFSTACKDTEHNAQNYLLTANSVSEASGVYTVTYKTNTASASYNITVGNLQNGEISWDKGFLTYDGGKEITTSSDDLIIDKDSDGHRYVTIDLSKVFFNGNDDMSELIAQGPNGDKTTTNYNSDNADHATEYYWKNVAVTVNYEDGSFIDNGAWSEAPEETAKIKNHSNYTYKFDLTKGSGTYKVTVKMWNNYTSNYVTKSIEFTLDAESTNKNVNLNTVWGVILIVLSVGLLAGVIFYFVKTARATRFVDAPRAIKNKDKKAKKETIKAVAKTENTEAPKNDAK